MDSIWVIALAYPAIIALLFYFAFLRPVQQHQKKQRSELQSLRVGDEVLTQAGFIARIKEVRVPEEPRPDGAGAGPRRLRGARGGQRDRAAHRRRNQRGAEPAPAETTDKQASIQARGHS